MNTLGNRATLACVIGFWLTALVGALSRNEGFAMGGTVWQWHGLGGNWFLLVTTRTWPLMDGSRVLVTGTTTRSIELGPDATKGLLTCLVVGIVFAGIAALHHINSKRPQT